MLRPLERVFTKQQKKTSRKVTCQTNEGEDHKGEYSSDTGKGTHQSNEGEDHQGEYSSDTGKGTHQSNEGEDHLKEYSSDNRRPLERVLAKLTKVKTIRKSIYSSYNRRPLERVLPKLAKVNTIRKQTIKDYQCIGTHYTTEGEHQKRHLPHNIRYVKTIKYGTHRIIEKVKSIKKKVLTTQQQVRTTRKHSTTPQVPTNHVNLNT